MYAEMANRAIIEAVARKRGNKCQDCKLVYTRERRFHWHHRNPEEKLFGIGDVLQNMSMPVEMLYEELAKCDLLCSGCHVRRHKGTTLTDEEVRILESLRYG